MTDTYKTKKNKQLGMPYVTARQRLVKSILFSLLQELGRDVCYRCSLKIENIDELTIEHIKSWVDIDIRLFWDLTNISFSHHSCNSLHGSAIRTENIKKSTPSGKSWCRSCKEYRDITKFGNLKSGSNGVHKVCRDCRQKDEWGHKNRRLKLGV